MKAQLVNKPAELYDAKKIAEEKPKLIEVANLTKIYGKGKAAFSALTSINLTIYQGETVAIIGKSGSGKSTLMHHLALLDTPTTGSIKIHEKDTKKLKKRQINRIRNRQFGFVFQQFFMNPSDSVLENVLLPLKISGTRRKTRKKLAKEAIEIVGLSDKLKAKAVDLSGGQKQRVCIARAIVNNPKVIFADEPTGNLDSTTGEKITDLLFNLNKERGATLIVVTHDEDLAKLCERVIRISDGKIISDYYQKPPTTRRTNSLKLKKRTIKVAVKKATRREGIH